MPEISSAQPRLPQDLLAPVVTMLQSLVQALVAEPDRVSIQTSERGDVFLFLLTVASSDAGRVIGAHGRTAESLRSILGAVALRSGLRFDLEIRSEDR
jgi:predicted RNA-binding protein YlqC (UPF0109 family)